jgi:transposase-like protein
LHSFGKHERSFSGFDDKIIAMYARGISVREIQGILVQMYKRWCATRRCSWPWG